MIIQKVYTHSWIGHALRKERVGQLPDKPTLTPASFSNRAVTYLPAAPREVLLPSHVSPSFPNRVSGWPPLRRAKDSHAPDLSRPFSSNPVAKVPEEALELGMLAGEPALGAIGADARDFAST
jgi:hypothetical protein